MVFVVSTWLGHGPWHVVEYSWCSCDCVFWIKLTLNLVVSDQSTMPFIVGVGLIHSVEGLNGTTRLSLQRILLALGLELQHCSFLGLRLAKL